MAKKQRKSRKRGGEPSTEPEPRQLLPNDSRSTAGDMPKRRANEAKVIKEETIPFLPASSVYSTSFESLAVIPHLSKDAIAVAVGTLSLAEEEAIERLLQNPPTVSLPKAEPAKRKGRARATFEIEGERVDYGGFYLWQDPLSDEVVLFRRDDTAVPIGIPLIGIDRSETQVVREAIRVASDESESAARRTTAIELLRIWTFVRQAESSWSKTRFYHYSTTYQRIPCQEEPPLLTDGMQAFFPIELLVKLAKLAGSLIERFAQHQNDPLVIAGTRAKRRSAAGGKKKADSFEETWEQRFNQVASLAETGRFSGINSILRIVIEKEIERKNQPLSEDTISRRIEHFAKELDARFPDKMKSLRAALQSR